MNSPILDRRTFLKGSGLTLSGFGLGSLLPGAFVRHALAAGPFDNKRLFFIFMRGGNDAVNTIIPHGAAEYNNTNRPSLYIAPGDAIDLGNGFASFHPAMQDLMEVHDAGELASVHRVGYPSMSRSHFDGQRIWENGNPDTPSVFEGWLYRYMLENAAISGDMPALTVQGFQPLLLRGDEQFINVADPDNFGRNLSGDARTKYDTFMRDSLGGLGGRGQHRPLLTQTGIQLMDSLDEIDAWDQANWSPTHPNTGDFLFPVDAATDPAGRFADSYDFFRSLKLCTLSLLESDALSMNGTRVTGTQLQGFDTHNGQGQLAGVHPTLIEAVSYGIKSLRIALSGAATNEPRGYTSIWNDTVVVTMSEFGRTTIENGSDGTDHGNAAAVFLAGGSVNGGLYNSDSWEAGALSSGTDGRDLSYVTDYRALMWEVLRDHMGADPAKVDLVFPDYSQLGLNELNVIV